MILALHLPNPWRGLRLLAQLALFAGLFVIAAYPLIHVAIPASNSLASHSITRTPTRTYGFASALAPLSQSELDKKLAAMAATGATWVRFDLSWDAVQPHSAKDANWADSDRILAAIKAHGLSADVIIDFTPAWARGSGCNNSQMCPPADPAAFGSFAKIAAQRYGSEVAAWEIWNEANISYRYHNSTNPAFYTKMLKAAYQGIKSINPDYIVIVGGTAPSGSNARNLTPSDFLKALYAAGAQGYFDAVAAHPYTYPDSPADNLPYGAWGQLPNMHAIMSQHGDGNKQIWLTEFGAPTNGPNETGDHVSEDRQAQILSDALASHAANSWMGPLFWYDFQDVGPGTWTSENFYGLLRYDGTPKPAYQVWITALSQP